MSGGEEHSTRSQSYDWSTAAGWVIPHDKADKQLHLCAFCRPVSLHTGAWRYPGAYADANFNFTHIKSFIQKLEAAKFDAFFMADHLAVGCPIMAAALDMRDMNRL